MPIIAEDIPLGTRIFLVGGKEKEYNKCIKCGEKAYPKNCRSRWELYSSQFKNLCYDCFKKEVNSNLTDDIIKLYADDYLEMGAPYCQGLRDLTEDNFNKFVEPVIKKLKEEREKAAQEKYHQEKLAEAQKIIDNINNKGIIDSEEREKEIIAGILEVVDKIIKDNHYVPEPRFGGN